MFGLIDELRITLETLRDDVARRRKERGQIVPWVFHRDGEPVKTFRRVWANACAQAACPGRIPHDFRRTAVRNLVCAGVPERVAMTMSGHKTRSVFERYNIVSDGDVRAAFKRLNDWAVQIRKNVGVAI